MRILLSILFTLLMISSAMPQTQQSRAQLTTTINTNFSDNTSGAITPALARAAYLNMIASGQVINATSVDNASYPMVAADRYVHTTATALTAVRTITLPAAAALNKGEQVVISDAGAAINGANTLVVAKDGSDTINQGSASIVLATPGAGVILETDGVSNWGFPQVPAASLGSIVTPAGGRLTLQTHTPVMTTTQAPKSVVYYDCYASNSVPYFDGVRDRLAAIPACEVSTTLQAASTGVINSGDTFDVWWDGANSNICVATDGSGGGWSADASGSVSARGTGYSELDRSTRPYATNANALAHCYNGSTDYGSITANQATYLGTFFSTSAGQTGWTYGTASSGGGAAAFYLWNMYNRVAVTTTVNDDGAPYDYTSDTIRQARNSSGNQIEFVVGVAEDSVIGSYSWAVSTSAGVGDHAFAGLQLNATTTFRNNAYLCYAIAAAIMQCRPSTFIIVDPLAGYNYLSANEQGDGSTASTFQNLYLSFQFRM
jgi:hypothetical protein